MTNEHSIAASAVGKAGFDVRLVPANDIETTVLPLWRKGMSDPEIVNQVQSRFSWLYAGNPAGRTYSWVVVDRGSQEVLGACSLVPHRLRVGNVVLRAGQIVDFIVDPRARVAGPAIALQRGLAEQSSQEGFDLLFGYPNRKAWPIFARAGYKDIGGTRMWARSLRIDPPRVLRMIEGRLNLRLPSGPLRSVSSVLCWPIAWAVQAASRALEARQLIRSRRLNCRLQKFGGEAPQLSQLSASLLSTDHSPEHLRWRFARHPTHDYRIFELYEGLDCIAWAIVRFYVESAEVQAVEWLNTHPALPSAMWWQLAHAVRSNGMQVLSINLAGSTDVDRSLSASLFIERPDDRKVILRAVNPPTASLLASVPSLATGVGWQLFAGTLDI